MLTLFHAPHSRSARIVWLLEELGAEYTIRYTDIVYGDGSGRRDPGNVHPDGKVPALIHDGTLITESTAIALYLCDLLPEAGLGVPVGARERGPFLSWLTWADNELGPAVLARMYGPKDDSPRGKAAYEAAWSRIERALERGPYLMGEHFTAVDVMIGAALAWARSALPPSALLDRYVARIGERTAKKRACAKDAPKLAA